MDRVPAVEVHRLVEHARAGSGRSRAPCGRSRSGRPACSSRRFRPSTLARSATARPSRTTMRICRCLSISMWLAGLGVARHDLRGPREPAPERSVRHSGSLEALRLLERVDGLLRVGVEHRARRRRRVAELAQPVEQRGDERALVAVGDRRRAEGDADRLADVAVARGRQDVDGDAERRAAVVPSFTRALRGERAAVRSKPSRTTRTRTAPASSGSRRARTDRGSPATREYRRASPAALGMIRTRRVSTRRRPPPCGTARAGRARPGSGTSRRGGRPSRPRASCHA